METPMENVENLVASGPIEPEVERPRSDGRRLVRRRVARSREQMRGEIHRMKLQRRALMSAVAVLVVVLLALGVWAVRVQREGIELTASVNRAGAQLAELREELGSSRLALHESRRSVDGLVADRLPGVAPIAMMEPLRVDQPFIRHIAFEPNESGLEVKLVVENGTDRFIEPAYTVTVFDRVGIELGRVRVTDGSRPLRQDEIRTFFAELELMSDDEARYFRVTAR
jgi:hypothetical protein